MRDNRKIDRLDFLILCIITLVYAVMSFINLGDTAAPTTQPEMENNQYITYVSLEGTVAPGRDCHIGQERRLPGMGAVLQITLGCK